MVPPGGVIRSDRGTIYRHGPRHPGASSGNPSEVLTVSEIGVLDFLKVWAYIIIGRLFANAAAGVLANTEIGKALAVVAA